MSNEQAKAIRLLRDALEAARNEAYPVPDSPHASVNQLAINNRTAFTRGWQAALRLTESATAAPIAAGVVPEYKWSADGKSVTFVNYEECACAAPAHPVAGAEGLNTVLLIDDLLMSWLRYKDDTTENRERRINARAAVEKAFVQLTADYAEAVDSVAHLQAELDAQLPRIRHLEKDRDLARTALAQRAHRVKPVTGSIGDDAEFKRLLDIYVDDEQARMRTLNQIIQHIDAQRAKPVTGSIEDDTEFLRLLGEYGKAMLYLMDCEPRDVARNDLIAYIDAQRAPVDEAPELINIGSMMYQGRTVTDWVITCKGLLAQADEAQGVVYFVRHPTAKDVHAWDEVRPETFPKFVDAGFVTRTLYTHVQPTAAEAQGAVAWRYEADYGAGYEPVLHFHEPLPANNVRNVRALSYTRAQPAAPASGNAGEGVARSPYMLGVKPCDWGEQIKAGQAAAEHSKQYYICPRCDKATVDGAVHTCTPPEAERAEPDARALFEHHERASNLSRSEGGEDDYANPYVQSAWEGWQAARAANQQPAGGDTDNWIVFGGRRMGKTYLTELTLDAARYRWLRQGASNNRMPHITQYPAQQHDDPKMPQIRDVGMDAAIDAARAAAPTLGGAK